MTWQGVALGFLIGFLTWPAGTVVMTLVDVVRSRIAVREYRRAQEELTALRAQEAAYRKMTVDEWESYYGPLPKRDMLP